MVSRGDDSVVASASGPSLAGAAAATEDDLAFANFGAATEFLVFQGARALEPVPVATDLVTASDALESYLGQEEQ